MTGSAAAPAARCRNCLRGSFIADLTVEADPFQEAEPKYTYAIFLDKRAPSDALEKPAGQSGEKMVLGYREIFVHYGSGMGRPKLRIPAARMGTASKMNAVAKLAEIVSKP